MERDDSPDLTPPVERRKRPVWAWLSIGGGVTLIAILTATAMELALRPLSTQMSEGMQEAPVPSPADVDFLATIPATPSAPDPAISPTPASPSVPPPAAATTPQPTEALPAKPLDAPPPQSARVPMRAAPARPPAPTSGRGRDG